MMYRGIEVEMISSERLIKFKKSGVTVKTVEWVGTMTDGDIKRIINTQVLRPGKPNE